MEKERVIKLRNALKAGKNIPLSVYIDNAFRIIDESLIGHFTFWDDENGYLYEITYIDDLSDHSPTNEKRISAFCVDYDSIQCMQAASIPLADIDDLFASMKEAGKTVDEGRIKMIKNFFDVTLDPSVYNLSRDGINRLIGSKLNTNDDYYNGKFTENFAEAVRYKERNNAIDKEIADKKN